MNKKTNFVNLHGHTEHSHLDAIIRVDQLFDRAKELGQTAVAITDHGVMGSVWEAYKAYKRTGVKYIPGNEIYFSEDLEDKNSKRGHLILLAKNEVGYRNLLRLTYEGFKNPAIIFGKEIPRLDSALLRKYNEGIICTSACMSSLLADGIFNKSEGRAEELAGELKDIFGSRFFLEIQPHDLHFVRKNKDTGEVVRFNQLVLNNELIRLAKKLKIHMVATCDSHYLVKEDEPYHDMIQAISSKKSLEDLTRKRYAYRPPCKKCDGHGKFPADSKKKCFECQGSGSQDPRSCAEYYLKTEDEILTFFTKHYSNTFAKYLVNNTALIAAGCENPDYIEPTGDRLPVFDMTHIKKRYDYNEFCSWRKKSLSREEEKDDISYMKFFCWKGFREHCAGMTKENKSLYWNQLLKEIDVLSKLGLASYMLIVADFIWWARKNGVYVGAGRGCLAGDTLVLTNNGYVRLDNIKIGDSVYTHTGELKKVLDTFTYKVSGEELLELYSDSSSEPLVLTKDHEVYGSLDGSPPYFISGDKLSVGDFLWTPWLKGKCYSSMSEGKVGGSSFERAYNEKGRLLSKGIPSTVKLKEGRFVAATINPVLSNKKGYFSKITKISTTSKKLVYDITVEDNHSYITSNSAVHNSAGGSIAAFFMGIHEVDSLHYNLLFERFHNLQKKGLADIDIDFSPADRPKVYNYVKEKYGDEHVSYISNISRITPKVAIKDVSRSLQIGGDKSTAFTISNRVTSSIPDKVTLSNGKDAEVKTIEMAKKYSKELQVFLLQYPEVEEHAKKIIGLPRNFSTHAGGVIISDVVLPEYTPLRMDKDGAVATQYDKKVCEDTGLVKMDFLAIKTLDIMKETYNSAKRIGISLPRYNEVPLDDEKTYRLISSGRVLGVFQLEGRTLMKLCKPMKPKSIADLALINALGRPSCSQEMRESFIERRFGREKITFQHPLLEKDLKRTLGVTVYEEDLLRMAQHIAGWDLGEADSLRKLTKMKAKNPEFALALEKKFIADVVVHSKVSEKEATMIWNDVIVSWTKYGFNAAHAVAYGIMGYRTAFYKAHATAPLLCANLNDKTKGNSLDKEARVALIKKDIRSFGISIHPCDINNSKEYYSVVDKKTIVTGFGAAKGVGTKALENIVENQPYSSFEDFINRTSSSAVNKTTIQSLAKAGAFDSFGVSRKYIFDNFAVIRKDIQKYLKKNKSDVYEDKDKKILKKGCLDNFKASSDELKLIEWSKKDVMIYEKEALGEYLSGSAKVLYPGFFKGGVWETSLLDIQNMPSESTVALEGVVTGVRELEYKRGKNAGAKFAKLTVENILGDSIDVTVWHDIYAKIKQILEKGDTPIRGMFKVNEWGDEKSLVLTQIKDIYRER